MTAASTGALSRLRRLRESVYGTAPSGNFYNMPYYSSTLGSVQGLITDNLIGQGRDPLDPARDVINVTGDIVVPVDARFIGFWLADLLGVPATTNPSGHYQHLFTSGGLTLPSTAIEIAHPSPGKFFMEAGCKLNSMALNFQRSGQAQATLSLIGQSENRANSTAAGSPIDETLTRFSQFNGAIKLGGTVLGNIVSGGLTYSNNLETQAVINATGQIAGIDPGVAAATGNIVARFTDTVLLDDAIAGTPVALDFNYAISADILLNLSLPRVLLGKPSIPVSGPGAVQITFPFQGARDPSAGYLMQAKLCNDLDGTAYAAG